MANQELQQSPNGVKLINKKIKAENRHWRNFQDKNYLGAHNLEDGEEMLLTIAKFSGEEKVKTADGEKTCMVLYFQEDVQKMILNVTNANTISSLYGTHPDSWVGKKVQIYPARGIKAFGKIQDALRIRDFAPRVVQDATAHIKTLNSCKTLQELVEKWDKLPTTAKNNKEIFALKEKLKVTLK